MNHLSRQPWWRILALATLSMMGFVGCSSGPDKSPNVLLVSIDTLRSDHLHSYGYERETSPNIDRIAAEGVRFAQSVSPSSWTLPTHMSMLTSIPPTHHGVIRKETAVAPDALMLAEVFSDAGYRTAGFVAAALLHPRYGFAKGFETYDHSTIGMGGLLKGVTSPALEALVTDWMREWRREADRKPFFVFLHLWDVHYDYVPPSPYDEMFDPGYDGPVDGKQIFTSDLYSKDMAPRDLAHMIALYDGEIRFTDHHLGKVFDLLEKMGEFDDTIITVTGDHGDEFFEHGRKGHRMTMFEEMVRVPLLIRYPKQIPPGVVVPEQVRLMDIGPTLLALAGIPQPPGYGLSVDGPGMRPYDLRPWIERDSRLPRLTSFGNLHGSQLTIRTERLKLIHAPKRGFNRLYDLTVDPGEQNNVAGKMTEETFLLEQAIHEFSTPLNERKARPIQPDKKQIERLRTLGYIQ